MLAKTVPELEFYPTRSGLVVDLAAHLAVLPPDAKGKGMYFRDIMSVAEEKVPAEELAARAGIPHRRYIPFFDYPMAELLKVTLEVAAIVHPKLTSGDALRVLGRRSYVTLLGSHAGRVLLASLGNDIERVFLIGPKAYRMVMNFGHFSSERVGERHIHFACGDFPAFLETYQLGVLEGVFEHFGIRGDVRIAMQGIGKCTFDVRWAPKD